MPASGWGQYQPGDNPTSFDPVAWSPDFSSYHALAPGGRFPGDLEMFLEYLGASDPGPGRDPASPDPDYTAPGWTQNVPGSLGKLIGWFARQHQENQRAGGLDPISDPLRSGPPYFPWSGPGAPYGPEGGPLHGTLDAGGDRLQDRDYGPDRTPPPGAPTQPRGNGGGGGSFDFQFQPYQGMQHTPQFVGWNPTMPFTVGSRPGPGASSIRSAPPPQAVSPPKGGAGKPPAAGGGGPRPGKGGRVPNRPAAAQPGRPDQPARPGQGQPMTPDELRNLLLGPPGSRAPHAGAAFREGGQRGYDVGMLDKGSPGWTRDPTTGILNTAGFPLPTPESPRAGESADAYMTRLHDQGYDNESILGLLSGWGTGPVMRDPNTGELVFAKDATAWVGPNTGTRGETPIYFGGKSPEQLAEEDRQLGIGREMGSFLRGGGGGFMDALAGMFNFGGNNLY